MNRSFKQLLCVAFASTLLLAGCSSDDDDDGGSTGGDTGGENPVAAFDFPSAAPSDYAIVDRMGMPAVATALIASKDSYNETGPDQDIAGTYVQEIIDSLTFLHGALDGQLQGMGLTPCTVIGDGMGTCVQAAGPLIIPDTIKIDSAGAARFPNGRLLSDPVIDVTLAVALLELTGETPPHTAVDLVGALNPAANDKEFSTAFPFLATPHE